MTDGQFPLLSAALWAPTVGAAIVLLTRGRSSAAALAMLTSLISLVVIVSITLNFDRTMSGYQFLEERDWMPALGLSYRIGVDGISILMLLLTALLTPLVIATSWLSNNRRAKEKMAAIHLLETG